MERQIHLNLLNPAGVNIVCSVKTNNGEDQADQCHYAEDTAIIQCVLSSMDQGRHDIHAHVSTCFDEPAGAKQGDDNQADFAEFQSPAKIYNRVSKNDGCTDGNHHKYD